MSRTRSVASKCVVLLLSAVTHLMRLLQKV